MKQLALKFIIFAFLLGCSDAFEVENLDPIITSIDPVYNDNGALRINFTLNDFEGDDTAVIFEICEANETKCGFGELDRALTDPLARLHTIPKKTNVAHTIVWDFSCGRVDSEGTRIVTDDQIDYVAKLTIKDQKTSLKSKSFKLQSLELTSTSSECEN